MRSSNCHKLAKNFSSAQLVGTPLDDWIVSAAKPQFYKRLTAERQTKLSFVLRAHCACVAQHRWRGPEEGRGSNKYKHKAAGFSAQLFTAAKNAGNNKSETCVLIWLCICVCVCLYMYGWLDQLLLLQSTTQFARFCCIEKSSHHTTGSTRIHTYIYTLTHIYNVCIFHMCVNTNASLD